MKRRLDVLDGLRGLAIVLVVLNHIDSKYIAQTVPAFIRPFIYFIFTSGNLGVTFFFILSGFLMGYLYSCPPTAAFIQRRYARIFPPFLVMTVCMFVFHLYPATPLFLRIALMLFIAFIARLLWVQVVEKHRVSSLLIMLFLCVQLGAAIWYGGVIMRHPALWFDTLPSIVKQFSILAANATLTLPFGSYIPLLDGVYWSLAPEVLFYLLYPTLFAGIIQALHKKRILFIVVFLVSLFPLFFGLSLLFKHSQGLTMLFVEYFIYFCGGLTVASLLHTLEKKKSDIKELPYINIVSFSFLLLCAYLVLSYSSGYLTVIMRLCVVIPFASVVFALLYYNSPLKRLLEKDTFLFLGTISYSLYITHTAIIDGIHLFFKPSSLLTNIFFIALVGSIALCVSWLFHIIIEKPYFLFKPKKVTSQQIPIRNKWMYIYFCAFILFLFFSTYTSQFNFFSLQKKYTNVILKSKIIDNKPFTFSFTSQEDNMGVVLFHLTQISTNTTSSKPVDEPVNQRFQIRIKEKGATRWYASQDTPPAVIGDSTSYPFGFPTIPHSKNKTYIVEMIMTQPIQKSTIQFHHGPYDFVSVHQIPKKQLLTRPFALLALVGEKLHTVISTPEALVVALCITPFFILLFVL
jgi:peptidoglycan/LPS O-acetylase OafA/YrhL